MDSKKRIKQFIGPNWIPVIILLVIPFFTAIGLIVLLCATLPTASRAKKSIAKLEAAGELDKAAEELTSSNVKTFMKSTVICSDNYMFCKRTGYLFKYDEIMWVYKHRFTQRVLFIPVKVTDSIYVATKTTKAKQVALMGKDKMDEIKNLILEIYRHNSSCLVGYSQETQAKYKQLVK